MTDSNSTNLEERLDRATTRAEAAVTESDSGSIPDEEEAATRERAEKLAEDVSSASLGDLLDAAGFETVPGDVAPTDLPMLMQDASPDAVLRLRRLLELAEIGDEWSDLDDEARLDRLDRVVSESEAQEASRSLGDLLSAVWSAEDGADEAEGPDGDDPSSGEDAPSAEARDDSDVAVDPAESTADGAEADENAEGDAGSEDEGLAAFRENVDQLRTMLESMVEESSADDPGSDAEGTADATDTEDPADAADEEPSDDAEAVRTSDERSGGRARSGSSRLSTMPASRSRLDMGRSTRFSTMRGRK